MSYNTVAPSTSILSVDDDKGIRALLEKILKRWGYEVETASTISRAMTLLEQKPFDVVLLDLKLPDGNGAVLLKNIKTLFPDIDVIMMSGYGSIQDAVKCIKAGAADFITKPILLDNLKNIIEKSCRLKRLSEENKLFREHINKELKINGGKTIIGCSKEMKSIYRVIKAASRNLSTVLITGETGTGKDLVANAIHEQGITKGTPYMVLNCANMSPGLIESQLFGHMRGSFTGAVSNYKGLIRSANGGTVFLDEITEIPLGLQSKLLRVLEDKKVMPLGSIQSHPVEFRLIAATNVSLEDIVKDNKFREDLYYRLNVIRLTIPPIRKRQDDIPPLVNHFNKMFARSFKTDPYEVSREEMFHARSYAWPGNVRELKNYIERAYAMGDKELRFSRLSAVRKVEGLSLDTNLDLEHIEKSLIVKALNKTGGVKAHAAKILGIDKKRLYRKLHKYGLARNSHEFSG